MRGAPLRRDLRYATTGMDLQNILFSFHVWLTIFALYINSCRAKVYILVFGTPVKYALLSLGI